MARMEICGGLVSDIVPADVKSQRKSGFAFPSFKDSITLPMAARSPASSAKPILHKSSTRHARFFMALRESCETDFPFIFSGGKISRIYKSDIAFRALSGYSTVANKKRT